MTRHPHPTADALIEASLRNLRARRGHRFIHAGGRGMATRTPGEQILYLPNGDTVKVTTDDSGIATQVEEDERLHAVVRPTGIRSKPPFDPSIIKEYFRAYQ